MTLSVDPRAESVPTSVDRRGPHLPAVAAAAVTVALVVLAVALQLGGGAPEPSPLGLPDAGAGTGWALPAARLLGHAAVVAVVATLLAPLLAAGPATVAVRHRLLVGAGLAWAAAAAAQVALGASEATGRPLRDALATDLLSSYARELSTGRALLLQVLAGLAVAAAAGLVRRPWHGAALLVGALLAVVPLLRTGHAATAADHDVAVWSLTAHVLGAVLWVGGVLALLLLPAGALGTAVRRASPAALVCAVLVAGSGTVGAWTRLPTLDLVTSTGYGALVLGKAALLLALAGIGLWHRRRTLPALTSGRPGALRRLAAAELVLMGATVGLATALSRTPL